MRVYGIWLVFIGDGFVVGVVVVLVLVVVVVGLELCVFVCLAVIYRSIVGWW